MNLEQLITELDTLFLTLPNIESNGYGEKEAIDTSKKGVLYMRAYTHLIEADKYFVKLQIYVVDDVLPDLSDRLSVQSRTLTTIKEITQLLIQERYIDSIANIDYTPTRLQGSDQHEGWYLEVRLALEEEINVCNT